MALQFCDSLDAYTQVSDIVSKWFAYNSGQIYPTAGKFGGNAYGTTNSAYSLYLTANVNVASGATLYAGWWTYIGGSTSNGLSATSYLFTINDADSILGVNSVGNICLTNGNDQTVYATSPMNITNGWHWIEFSIRPNGASTPCTLFVDGIQQFSGTYALSNFPAQAITKASIGFGYNFANGSYLDDPIFWDNSGTAFNTFPIGPRRIGMLAPSAAGTDTQFTPSTGANYQCVSQAYSGTAYVSDTGTGNVDTYETAGLAYTPKSTINAVVVNSFAFNPAADGTKSITNKLLSSGTIESGASHVLSGVPMSFQDAFYLDSTGAAWTKTSVGAAQPGVGD
jgi:hypothetical protein